MPISSTKRRPRDVVQTGAGNLRRWSDLGNAKRQDGQYSYVDLPNSNGAMPLPGSYFLIAKNFGFNGGPNSIPAGATIRGIRVQFGVLASEPNQIVHSVVQLTKDGTSAVGRNNGNQSDFWPSTDEGKFKFGGAKYRWKETWTAAEIRDRDFGVILQVENYDGAAVTALLDSIRITVWFET